SPFGAWVGRTPSHRLRHQKPTFYSHVAKEKARHDGRAFRNSGTKSLFALVLFGGCLISFRSGSLGSSGFLGGLLFRSLLRGEFGGQGLGGGDLFGLARGAGVGGGLTLIGLDALGAGIGRFEDTRRLAATIAQVIELGSPHLAALEHFDAVDHRRVDRE